MPCAATVFGHAQIKKRTRHVQAQGIIWAYRAQRALLLARAVGTQHAAPLHADALTAARQALELADETARTSYPYEVDYMRAHWLLGAAHRAAGSSTGSEQALDAAERGLSEALTRCRGINMVYFEADILLDLVRLRAAAPLQSLSGVGFCIGRSRQRDRFSATIEG
jgi:hypothetical protein